MRMFTSVFAPRVLLSFCAAALFMLAEPVKAHHGGAHFLDIYEVTCWAYNDPSGSDEPYLKLNGNRIWSGGDCSPIETMYPGVTTDFWNQVDLYIMEDDFGSDDTVGYVLVGPQSGQGTITYYSYKWIDNMGWVPNYSMDYRVYQ